mmetsp:Transcript_2587/g.3524  ORF Transcript_2587/g.3524 Transcript_2587/m.3524 type:complete len:207 (-) Transcript_2587:3010-3630(-)
MLCHRQREIVDISIHSSNSIESERKLWLIGSVHTPFNALDVSIACQRGFVVLHFAVNAGKYVERTGHLDGISYSLLYLHSLQQCLDCEWRLTALHLKHTESNECRRNVRVRGSILLLQCVDPLLQRVQPHSGSWAYGLAVHRTAGIDRSGPTDRCKNRLLGYLAHIRTAFYTQLAHACCCRSSGLRMLTHFAPFRTWAALPFQERF